MSSKPRRKAIIRIRRKKPSNDNSTVASALTKAVAKGFRLAGGAVGGYFGAPGVGYNAGAALSKVLGFGDYKVKSNTLMSNGVPVFSRGKRSIRVRHREFLGDINSVTGFSISNTYPLNPGLSITFPWLSTLANSYQQYRIHGMLFEFVSTSADALNSTNTALGQVVMATQYDSTRPLWSTKAEMESAEFSCSGRPSANLIHPIECDVKQTPIANLYIRNDDTSGDIRMTDLGYTSIAVVNTQAASVVGELWITYDVELLKPVMPSGGVSIETSAIGHATTGITNSTVFGTNMAFYGGDFTIFTNTLYFPSFVNRGTYVINVIWTGSSTAVTGGTITYTNCANAATSGAAYDIAGNDFIALMPGSGLTTNRCTLTLVINVTGQAPSINLSGYTLPTSATYVDLFISCMQPGL